MWELTLIASWTLLVSGLVGLSHILYMPYEELWINVLVILLGFVGVAGGGTGMYMSLTVPDKDL